MIYGKIPSEETIWGKSALESIIPLIDAADRQLLFAQLNTAFFANDILVYEENAFAADAYGTDFAAIVGVMPEKIQGEQKVDGNPYLGWAI